jgi:hypothetical protein
MASSYFEARQRSLLSGDSSRALSRGIDPDMPQRRHDLVGWPKSNCVRVINLGERNYDSNLYQAASISYLPHYFANQIPK